MTGLPMIPKAPGAVPDSAASRTSPVVEVAVRPSTPANALPPSSVDSSSPEAFIRGIAPYAIRVSQATGIPAEVLIGMAANETGFGKYAHGNNLFGIKGTGPAGSFNSQTWEDYGQGAVTINDNFRAYHSPAESLLDFAKLVMTSPRYAGAMGQTSVEGFVGALKRGGYMTDPDYVQKINAITTRYSGVIHDSLRSTGPAVVESGRQAPAPTAAGRGVIVPDQFGVGLPADEAYAACGPMAAIAFAQAYARTPTPQEAMALAKQSGWTAAGGMNGITNEKRLLDKMGIPARLETALDWDHVKVDALNRNPVILSTPGHYFVVDGFDPRTGAYHVGQSGLAYRGGSEWMTPAQISQLAGAPHAALYTDNPLAVRPSVAAVITTAPPVMQSARPVAAAPAPPPPPVVKPFVSAAPPPVVKGVASALPVVKPFAAPVEKGVVPPPVPQPVQPVLQPIPPAPVPLQPAVKPLVEPLAQPRPESQPVTQQPVTQQPVVDQPTVAPPPEPVVASTPPPPAPLSPPPIRVVRTSFVVQPEPAPQPPPQPQPQSPAPAPPSTVAPDMDTPVGDQTVAFQPPEGSALAVGSVLSQSTPKPPDPKAVPPRRKQDDE